MLSWSIPSWISYDIMVGWHETTGKIPFGKLSHNYGTSPFSMGKFAVSMVIFHSCVKLPEGIMKRLLFQCWMIFSCHLPSVIHFSQGSQPFRSNLAMVKYPVATKGSLHKNGGSNRKSPCMVFLFNPPIYKLFIADFRCDQFFTMKLFARTTVSHRFFVSRSLRVLPFIADFLYLFHI